MTPTEKQPAKISALRRELLATGASVVLVSDVDGSPWVSDNYMAMPLSLWKFRPLLPHIRPSRWIVAGSPHGPAMILWDPPTPPNLAAVLREGWNSEEKAVTIDVAYLQGFPVYTSSGALMLHTHAPARPDSLEAVDLVKLSAMTGGAITFASFDPRPDYRGRISQPPYRLTRPSPGSLDTPFTLWKRCEATRANFEKFSYWTALGVIMPVRVGY